MERTRNSPLKWWHLSLEDILLPSTLILMKQPCYFIHSADCTVWLRESSGTKPSRWAKHCQSKVFSPFFFSSFYYLPLGTLISCPGGHFSSLTNGLTQMKVFSLIDSFLISRDGQSLLRRWHGWYFSVIKHWSYEIKQIWIEITPLPLLSSDVGKFTV